MSEFGQNVVVNGLVDEMMQAALAGRADVMPGRADRFEALEHGVEPASYSASEVVATAHDTTSGRDVPARGLKDSLGPSGSVMSDAD